ncbi:hypothetical protein MKP05_13655 [Halomonas sp. EGI 63088]|uniref:Uncharacterized protein n=1 Tax=Halomonas flagellata TaxID=2920385 RepID=A0ABS9RWD5_9GAMM|nr:hypothetical protein [Halomonas flagellata]MCH4564158.1 hypothetical protein [Halomonas flagellata]
MLAKMLDLREAATLEDARAHLGEVLGLEAPASHEATRRALDDPKFAMYLMMTQNSPALRDKLLNAPGTRAYAESETPRATTNEAETATKGVVSLSTRVASAMVKWAKTGFRVADEELVTRRWKACQACEYLTAPPPDMIYQGVKLLTGKESCICSACGCPARRKAALPTEACPKEDPDHPGFTRWGDPVTPKYRPVPPG